MSQPSAVQIPMGRVMLDARLMIPEKAVAAVVIARADRLPGLEEARRLYDFGLASLSVALLAKEERDQDRAALEPEFLADRMEGARRWLVDHGGRQWRLLGLVGQGAAGSTALIAAGRRPDGVDCVVSRDGSAELPQDILGAVRCPVLLVAGKKVLVDGAVTALGELSCEKTLELHPLPGEEELWLKRHLRVRKESAPWY